MAAPLLLKPSDIISACDPPFRSRRALVVHDCRFSDVPNAVAGRTYFQTEVHIVVPIEESHVESGDFGESLGPYRETRARDAFDIASREFGLYVPRFQLPVLHPERDAGVLDTAVRIDEPRARHAR